MRGGGGDLLLVYALGAERVWGVRGDRCALQVRSPVWQRARVERSPPPMASRLEV